MGWINKWHIGLAVSGILGLVLLILSCSQGQSTPISTSAASPTASTLSPVPTENSTESPISTLPVTQTASPNPTGGIITPVIKTYQDLAVLAGTDPGKIDNSNFPITPVEALHPTTQAPPVDITQYKLTVDGLVTTPLSLTYDDILNYPAISEVVLLICAGAFVDNAEWTGVPVKTLLDQAGVKPEANEVHFHALDYYDYPLTIDEVYRDGVFLAYQVNGQTLPPEHGYPLRLVVKGRNGADWVKWLTRIEVKKIG